MHTTEPTPDEPRMESQDEMDEQQAENARVDLRDYVDARIDDLKESIRERLAALAENLLAAKSDADRRLGEMNKFRDQIKEERQDFATREYVDQKFAAFEDRISQAERASRSFGRGGADRGE